MFVPVDLHVDLRYLYMYMYGSIYMYRRERRPTCRAVTPDHRGQMSLVGGLGKVSSPLARRSLVL